MFPSERQYLPLGYNCTILAVRNSCSFEFRLSTKATPQQPENKPAREPLQDRKHPRAHLPRRLRPEHRAHRPSRELLQGHGAALGHVTAGDDRA